MNIRDIAQKVKGYIQSKTQDDEGWIRQGKFTPVKQAQTRIQQNIQTNPIERMGWSAVKTVSEPITKSLANIGALGATGLGSLQMARNKPESAQRLFDTALAARQYAGTTGSFDQGIKSGLNTLKTGGLSALQTALTGKGLKYMTPTNLGVSGLIGGVANKVSGGDFATGFGQGLGNTPQIMGFVGATNPLLNKFIPQTVGNIGGRVAGAGLNVAQGLGMDVARGTPTTAASVGLDVLTGLAGGKGQFETGGASVKGMTGKNNMTFKPKSVLKNEEIDIIDQINDSLGKNKDISWKDNNFLDNVLKQRTNATQGQLDSLTSKQKLNELLTFANKSEGFKGVSMGITDQPIKTGEVSTPQNEGIIWRSESGMDKNGVQLASGGATSFSTTKELASQYGEAKPFQLTKQPNLIDISQLQPENQGGIIPYNIWTKIEQTGGARGSTMESFLKSKGFDGYKSGEEMVLLNRDIVKPVSQISPESKPSISTPQNENVTDVLNKNNISTYDIELPIGNNQHPFILSDGKVTNPNIAHHEVANKFISTSEKPIQKFMLQTGSVRLMGSNTELGVEMIGMPNSSQMDSIRKAAYDKPITFDIIDNNGKIVKSGITQNFNDFKRQVTEATSQISPNIGGDGIKIKPSETIRIKPNEDLVKQFDETIKIKPSEKVKISSMAIEQPELKQRGFSASVQEAPNVSKQTKFKVVSGYDTKPNEQLMGEAKALLTEGGTIKDVKNIPDIDRKVTAAMQEALNLDAAGKHDEAAALFNNLSDIGTELGRGVQAYSLLQKMSPQAISLSAAGQIKKYNRTAKVKLPELTGEQQKLISGQVEAIRNMVDGKEKNIALNQLEQTINSFIPSSKTDKFITIWKAGLLTSLRTHLRNIVGNTMMQGGEITSQAPAGVADYLMSLRTGQRTISPTLKGTVSGAKEGLDQSIDIMKYGFDPSEEISKFDVKKITWKNTPTDQALKKYTDFVFNTLSAEDKPFWQSSYSRSLYNQAGAEAINQGQKGNTKVIQNLVNNASEEMKNQATIDANYATFKDKNMISNVASNFKRVMGNKWYGKLSSEIVAPFTGVPSSMLTKTFDYSPLGLLNGIKDAGKVVTKNIPDLQRQAAQEIGRGTIGTAIFGLGAYLASKGLITGQAKDDAERKQWELEGKQQNSILINGKWRSINSVGPQAIILLAGAKADEELNNPDGNIAKYGLGLVQDQLSQTFLSGVQQPLQAITDPNRYGKSYVGGQISSLTPNIVKDFSKALDPTQREVDTGTMGGNIKTSIQSGVPIWRNQMTPKRDTLGNILKQEPTGLGAFVDLFNSKTPISNNVVDELKRLNQGGYNATPSKIQKSQTINGTKVVLDQKSLDQYEEEAGKAVSTSLEKLFNSNSYQKLDDESKQEAIDKLVTAERKKVRANIDLKYMPDMGYVKSTDAPTSLGGKISVYGKSVITDPGQTIKAVIAGNPIRKVEGGTVILERKNSLGTLDKGNTSTQVDHKIALTLGGSNDESNLQVLTNEENKIKGQFETYLYKEMKAGRITKEEAQKKDLNWREEVGNIPKTEQTKIANSLKDESIDETSENVYKLVSEAGTVTTIDLDKEIEEPKLTGFTEVDKKLKSSYKSSITTRINNIVKLYEDGQLTAEEAEKYIKQLKAKSSSTGTGKSKKFKMTFKAAKYDIPKINIKFKKPTASTIKLKSAPKIKITSSRKYTINA